MTNEFTKDGFTYTYEYHGAGMWAFLEKGPRQRKFRQVCWVPHKGDANNAPPQAAIDAAVERATSLRAPFKPAPGKIYNLAGIAKV
jgi:hypothetical protein